MPKHVASIWRRGARFAGLAAVLCASAALAESPAASPKPAPTPNAAPKAPAANTANTPDTSSATKTASVVLVSGDGFEITTADVVKELSLQPGRLAAVRADPQRLKAVVNKMLRQELLAKEAERRGYGKNPMVVQAAREEAVQRLNRAEVDEKYRPSAVPAEEVKAYYEAQAQQFHRPAMRRARHILLDKQSAATALMAEARKADERGFQKLARKHSVDTETRQRGGDLRFFALEPNPKRRDAPVHTAIREATFELKALGDTVAKPVNVDGRYSIVRLTGIRDERSTSLADADSQIRTRLWRQKRRDALSKLMLRLRKEQKPEVFADRIQGIDLSDVAGRPPGFGTDRPAKRGTPGHSRKSRKQPHAEKAGASGN